MNTRSILLHAALLAGLLAVAWFRSDEKAENTPAKDAQGEVVLEGDLSALAYERDGKTLRVEARQDARGRWFRGESRVPKPAKPKPKPPAPHPLPVMPDASAPSADASATRSEGDAPALDAPGSPEVGPEVVPDAAPEAVPPREPQEPPQIEEKVFRVNGEALWKRLEPLRALRVIGPVDEARAKEYGLAEAQGKLTLTLAGKPQEIAIGGKAFGSSDTYARLPDGRAIVLPGDVASKLVFERGPLFETRLIETARPEIKELAVAQSGKTLVIVQHQPKERGQTFWARAGSDTGNDEYLAWVNKLFRLVAQEYQEGAPSAGQTERLAITVTKTDGAVEKLTLYEGKDADQKPEFRVVSEHTRLVASVPRQVASELLSDLAALLE